jgi:hypothetical protein
MISKLQIDERDAVAPLLDQRQTDQELYDDVMMGPFRGSDR